MHGDVIEQPFPSNNKLGILDKHMSIAEHLRAKVSALPWRIVGRLLLVSLLAGVVSAIFFKSAKTNGMYLQEIIENHALQKTASGLVAQYRTASDAANYSESDWTQLEERLSRCLISKATEYAASNDPYLKVRADMDSPKILAARFLRACGAAD